MVGSEEEEGNWKKMGKGAVVELKTANLLKTNSYIKKKSQIGTSS